MTKIVALGRPIFNSLILFVFCFCADEVNLFASGPVIGLSDLFERAEKNAMFEKDFNALRSLAKAKLSEVNSLRVLPSFDLKVIGGVIPDATVDPNNVNSFISKDLESDDFTFGGLGPFINVQLEAIQPIYTFGKISNYVDIAKRGQSLAEAEKNKKVAEIRYLIKKAYYTLQLSMDSLEILKDVESKLNDAAEKVEELLVKNAENVSETDRLKIKVFLADVKNRLLDADRANRLSRSALTEVAQLPQDWVLDQTSLSAEKVSDLKKEDLIAAALRRKPELQQLKDLVLNKESEYRAVQAELFPSLFLGGKLEYAKAPGRTDISNPYLNDPFNNFNFGIVLGLKQDLGFYRTLKKMEGLDAELQRLQSQKDQLEFKTKLDAEKSFEDAFSAMSAVSVNEDGFRAARSWLTSTGLAFNLGTAETKDVLESFAAYFKARFDLIKNLYTLNTSLADLSHVTGSEILDRLQAQSASPAH